ncbi:unnamed protein product [Eruca vesicaria subsp. sativa]|uniref:Uncharacterized protein n=1 Tax=Eruca vesicaria subsp. sativa TaxID=29727 RepID=A0ABC8L4H6_ERUVS|nr:unnamed protein product [Eruca vesicaria subsp. sativa]
MAMTESCLSFHGILLTHYLFLKFLLSRFGSSRWTFLISFTPKRNKLDSFSYRRAPMLTSRLWLDRFLIVQEKILVEVKLDHPFPQDNALEYEGTIYMVTVIYSWLPSKFSKCGQLGHKATSVLDFLLLQYLRIFRNVRVL